MPFNLPYWSDAGDIECDKCESPRNNCNCTGEDEWCKDTDHYYKCRKSECECRPNDKMDLCEECDMLIERCICEDEYCHDCYMDSEDYDCNVNPKMLYRHSSCCGCEYLFQVYPECVDEDHDKMMEQIGQKRKQPQPTFTKKEFKIRHEYLRKREVTKVPIIQFSTRT